MSVKLNVTVYYKEIEKIAFNIFFKFINVR